MDINKAIDASVELRNKKDLINQFITTLDIHSVVDEDWHRFIEERKIVELEKIIEVEKLKKEETKLDLAKAYQEMDDKEGAKEMLEEVIRDGDTKQKRAAKKLMKSL